jgi:murein DD-endopeptidase MepM/ murein hydrolase activator NlpD
VKTTDRFFLALALAVLLLALGAAGTTTPSQTLMRPLVRVRPLALPSQTRRASLDRGETLGGILSRLGVPSAELPEWTAAASRLLPVRALPVGMEAAAHLDFDGRLSSIRLTPDWRAQVVLERSDSGISARREPRPVSRDVVVVRGTVRTSLFEAMTDAGEDDTLAIQLAELFQWDIDFHREVREGDSFALLVERVRSGGRTVAYGPILAAEYVNAGKRHTAVRYASPVTSAGYYDDSGRPLRKQFLRAPLRFTRITSRFSMSRMHPILGRRMPHYGVDYGAPVGTPVMVTADGVVVSAGRHGGGGNEVKVRHAGGYTTAYLHLSRFARGIRPGTRVSQGEVIGFVGATGLATGPHLDYRVTRDGSYVNPLSIGGGQAPPLAAGEMPRFLAWERRVVPLLEVGGGLGADRAAAVVAASPFDPHA